MGENLIIEDTGIKNVQCTVLSMKNCLSKSSDATCSDALLEFLALKLSLVIGLLYI